MNRRELLLTIAAGAAGAAVAGLVPCKARGAIADPEPPDEREGPRAPAAPGPMLWPQTVDESSRDAARVSRLCRNAEAAKIAANPHPTVGA
jgi:hypothetical protein